MKKLAIAAATLMLAGCASIPQPKPQAQRSYTVPAKLVQPKPVEQPTPNQSLKKRWGYFQIPKWLHR